MMNTYAPSNNALFRRPQQVILDEINGTIMWTIFTALMFAAATLGNWGSNVAHYVCGVNTILVVLMVVVYQGRLGSSAFAPGLVASLSVMIGHVLRAEDDPALAGFLTLLLMVLFTQILTPLRWRLPAYLLQMTTVVTAMLGPNLLTSSLVVVVGVIMSLVWSALFERHVSNTLV